MLFPYTYVPHQMERMQEFVDFIFHKVWCMAPASGPFRLELFLGNPDLHEIMEHFQITDSAGGDFFYSHVERIYGLFSNLAPSEIAQLKRWYVGNNDIDNVCANEPLTNIVRYNELAALHPMLSGHLATFFKGLYSQSLLDLAVLRRHIGDIDDHYHSFVHTNAKGKCPFCGMNDLLGEYHTKREAYDHYLPKALYPFNSINFRNLVPACHHCNSSYKTSQNPAFQPKHPTHKAQGALRRKVFSPYAAQSHAIEIKIDLGTIDVSNLKPQDVSLQFGPAQVSEEIDTWRDVYGIDERYKAKLCGENDGKEWLVQILDEWRTDGRDPMDYMTSLHRHTSRKPFSDCNFLKTPFLDACERAGLFS